MNLADRARQVAAAAPRHQSAEVLRECADEIDRLRADLAALRALVRKIPYLAGYSNAALAAAKKMAGEP